VRRKCRGREIFTTALTGEKKQVFGVGQVARESQTKNSSIQRGKAKKKEEKIKQ